MISHEKIEAARVKLGDIARDIMVREIPIEQFDGKTGLSVFHKENTPSMTWFPERQIFKDFGTGQSMDYVDFAMRYHHLSFPEAVKEMFDLVGMDYEETDFNIAINNDYFGRGYKFPEDEPDNDRAIVNAYMAKRHISEATLDFYGVKQDGNGNIAFQFKNVDGKVVATKYRVSKAYMKGKTEGPKWWWNRKANMCPILYGIDKVNTTQPLIIVEGLNDALACHEAGIQNAVSIPGGAEEMQWIKFNYDFLMAFKIIILWFDDDEIGQDGLSKVTNALGVSRVKTVQINQTVKDEITKNSNGKVTKVDANNVLVFCGAETVVKMVNGAAYVPNPRLRPLSTYKEVELFDLPFISTGFKNLDNIVYGNFQNNLIVVTGRSAGGKSTVVNTMGIIVPLENDKKVMVFSGEANGGTLLGSIYRPIAGRRHIVKEDNSARGFPNFYRVTKQAKDFIRDYYMSLIYNYEEGESIRTDGHEILSQMDYAYNRYGVTFFTLDNLMCIETCGGEGDNKYSSQIEFAVALKKFTREHDVTVILVAHPKKMVAGQSELDMYSVAGASEIVNLADRVYGVGRLDPVKHEGHNSCITVLKDRQSGKVGAMAKMYYDFPTTRIYSDRAELEKAYSWEEKFNSNYPPQIKERLVVNMPDGLDEIVGEKKNE